MGYLYLFTRSQRTIPRPVCESSFWTSETAHETSRNQCVFAMEVIVARNARRRPHRQFRRPAAASPRISSALRGALGAAAAPDRSFERRRRRRPDDDVFCPQPGFVSSRNAPERRSCSFFDHPNAVPVLFGIGLQLQNSGFTLLIVTNLLSSAVKCLQL